MASDYGRNFGFRRSDESVRVSEGRFRTPASGAALLIGTAVQVDPAAPGFLKACDANAPLVPGVAGLLVQEEQHLGSVYEADVLDSYGLGVAKKNQLSVITTGAGTKVWYQNTDADNRADGRAIAGVQVVDLTGVALGDQLGWNGTRFVKVDATTTEAWMTVTAVDVAKGYVEGVLLK